MKSGNGGAATPITALQFERNRSPAARLADYDGLATHSPRDGTPAPNYATMRVDPSPVPVELAARPLQ